MLRSLRIGILLNLAVALSVIISGCKKESPFEVNLPQTPALTDPIPFDILGHGKLVFERIGPDNNNYSGIYVIDIDSKRSWQTESGIFDDPAVSPDGRRIAYTAPTSGETAYDVYIMNIDGTNRQRVSDVVGQENSPSWTFDGKQILFHAAVFTYNYSNGIRPLYRQSPVPNPPDKELLIDFGKIDPPYIYSPEGPVSASSTGKLVVSAFGIRTMNVDGSGIKLVVPQPTRGEELYSPTWSPDGQNMALLSLRRESTSIVSIAVLLYTENRTTCDTLITLSASGTTHYSGNNSYSLCWSPDGSQIAFTRPDGVYVGSHIFLIKKDHSGLTQVTFAEGVTDRSLSWSH